MLILGLTAVAVGAQITITTPKGMEKSQGGNKPAQPTNDAPKKEAPASPAQHAGQQPPAGGSQQTHHGANATQGGGQQQAQAPADNGQEGTHKSGAQAQNAPAGQQSNTQQQAGNAQKKQRKSESANSDFSTGSKSKVPQSQQTVNGRAGGYRVLAYIGNNARKARAVANKRARDIATRFPQYRVYFTYKAPTWRLRIGDFDDEDDAKRALRQLRSNFPQFAKEMTVIHDNINIWK